MREAIESSCREPVAVCKRHQDRLQPAAQQVLWQLVLLCKCRLE